MDTHERPLADIVVMERFYVPTLPPPLREKLVNLVGRVVVMRAFTMLRSVAPQKHRLNFLS
jgi:hypothetical protein